jgi:hypothetical protein
MNFHRSLRYCVYITGDTVSSIFSPQAMVRHRRAATDCPTKAPLLQRILLCTLALPLTTLPLIMHH